jgi:phenylalanyl-tRNA synthetase beta chain
MKIAYKHLLRFLKNKPSIEDISEKLFQLGHEHEIQSSVFDMEFTPNRGDCLSLLGLARDLNVFYETDLELNISNLEIKKLDLNFTNNVIDKCPAISFLNIQVEDIADNYEDYLESYFADLKLNKNNFFTDISNFIAYEMGQPTHCYDYNKLGEPKISLTNEISENKFKTLLDKDIELDGTDMVFSNHNKVINLAGIIGGMETACTNNTNDVLVECAYFLPESIIGRAVKYNVQSDASHKFERGVDPTIQEKALRRFIQIVADHAKIVKAEIFSYSSGNFQNKELEINFSKINSILGTNKNNDEYKDALIKLGFNYNKCIRVPPHRHDINNQNDLAEEFARVIGYNKITPKSISLPKIKNNKLYTVERNIKSFLIEKGFFEVINFPFCNDSNKDAIKVDNPLDSNREYLRTNVIDSLVSNIIYNEKRQKDSIKIFEISDIYSSTDILVDKKLAIAVSGRQGHNYKDFNKQLDKKYIANLFQEVGINLDEEILNISKDNLDSKLKTKIFAVELNIKGIQENFYQELNSHIIKEGYAQYEPISEFPSSSRDLSFSIGDSSKVQLAIETLDNIKPKFLKESFMFDYYKNNETDITKVGYRFIFQSHKKTLTDIEIDESITDIIEPMLLIESVTLPGLK